MKLRPGWLTTFCVFSMVLGAMGMMQSFFTAVSVVFSNRLQQAVMKFQPNIPNNPMLDAQRQMQEEMMNIGDHWMWVNIPLAGISFIVAGLLLWAGIEAYRLRPRGRKLLMGVFLATAVVDGCALAPKIMIQQEMASVQSKYMGQIMQSAGPPGRPMAGPQAGMMQSIMEAFTYVGIVFTVGWTLLLLGTYIGGFLYLRRPDVAALYAADPIFMPDEGDDTASADDWDL